MKFLNKSGTYFKANAYCLEKSHVRAYFLEACHSLVMNLLKSSTLTVSSAPLLDLVADILNVITVDCHGRNIVLTAYEKLKDERLDQSNCEDLCYVADGAVDAKVEWDVETSLILLSSRSGALLWEADLSAVSGSSGGTAPGWYENYCKNCIKTCVF